jgi:hypothetical protein
VAMQTRIEVGVMAHFFGVELDKNEEIHKQIKKLKGMRKQTNYALVEKIFGGLYIAQRERKKKEKEYNIVIHRYLSEGPKKHKKSKR